MALLPPLATPMYISTFLHLILLTLNVPLQTGTGKIQPVSLGAEISVIFGIQVSLRVHYCKK